MIILLWVVVVSAEPLVLLAYIQNLINSDLPEANIVNNLAALRALHIIHGLPTDSFQDWHIPLLPKLSCKITIEILQQVIAISTGLEHNAIFIAIYSFIFISFLHLLNLWPHTSKQCDFTRHMAQGGVIFTNFCATFIKNGLRPCRIGEKHVLLPFHTWVCQTYAQFWLSKQCALKSQVQIMTNFSESLGKAFL